jgi:hypothetical protein
MKTYNQQELKNILELHRKWVMNEAGGERADLRYADLSYADLSYADLRYANLRYADLSYADLRYANLRYADLRYANLRYADLSYADLSYANLRDIIEDFYKVLDLAQNEVPELYRALWDGRINGSAYEGDCACLVGTIANARNANYKKLEGLIPDAERASEKWFLGIQKGDCPLNSEIAKVTAQWIETFMENNKIAKPIRTMSWS